MALGTRIPIQAEREERTGFSGYSDAEIQDSHIRERMFLART